MTDTPSNCCYVTKIEGFHGRIIDVGQSMPQSARRNSGVANSQNNCVENYMPDDYSPTVPGCAELLLRERDAQRDAISAMIAAMPERRFWPPCSVEETADGFIIRDAAVTRRAYVQS
jgi:hypothetical protein